MSGLTIVVAVGTGGVIGRDGDLPWRIREDLRHFKRITMGHTIIMGRRTWDSIGRPLPGRQSVVVTRNRHFEAPGAVVVHSLGDAIHVSLCFFCSTFFFNTCIHTGEQIEISEKTRHQQIYLQHNEEEEHKPNGKELETHSSQENEGELRNEDD